MNVMIITALLSLIIIACTQINKKLGLKNDNPGEQILEEIIEDKTGIIIDLTPEEENERSKTTV